MNECLRSGGAGLRKTVLGLFGPMLALALLVWLPGGQVWAAAEPTQERMTATVVEFSVRGELNEQAGAIIADLMMSAIANTGRFKLKDRLPLSAAAKIAKAQELGSTGLLDPKTAAELGRLYGVDAVVTGGISKLGDLITVTARLIDTKTASLLGSGQVQDKDIDAIQIKVNDLAAMVMAPPAAPQTYALTVRVDPPDASIRLPNNPIPYQSGMRLPLGDYEIEVAKPGYVTRKQSVRISDRDTALDIVLEKARYGLTVRPEPPDAQIRLIGTPAPYQPGVALPPGDYEIEVAREGYVSHKFPVRIVDGGVTVPVTLEKVAPPPPPPPPPARQYRLTVQVDPPQATVRLLNARTPYRPGVSLSSGGYTVEISQSGYESTQVAVSIIDSDVTVPVKLTKKPEPAQPALYRLTVRSDPPDARVRLLGTKTAYKSGVSLPPGSYTVEVSRTGYETQQASVRIADSDVTVPVALVKQPEPERPTLYRLTVRSDPADARVRLLGTKTAYKSGVSLPPGSYTVEVSRTGYETRQASVRIADSDVTVPVALVKQPEPERPTLYRLTVRSDPPDAQVRLRGISTGYRPGVSLAPGNYTVEVSRAGYETQRITVRIADSDLTVPVALAKQLEAAQYRLTVRPNPSNAWVRLVNSPHTYRPGVVLPPGDYTVEVGGRGYESKRVAVRITDGDVALPVELEKTASVSPASPSSAPSRPGEWRIGTVRVDSSLSGIDRSEVSRVLSGYVGRTVTRDTLLDGAMQVYQSTGITLNFVVRSGSSGGAELYARAARQTRRTYESTISIMSRSQLERSGFGVSVE